MNSDYLTDERWELIASRLPGREGDPGCHGRDNRLFVEAVLWIVRTGGAWRSLPPRFGAWYTNYTRFRRWTLKGVWPGVLEALGADETCEYFFEEGEIRYRPTQQGVADESLTAPPAQTKEPDEAQSSFERKAVAPSDRSTLSAHA